MTVKEAFDLVHERVGCGDHSCNFKKPTGMGTNGGCRCRNKPGVMEALGALYKAIESPAPVSDKGCGQCDNDPVHPRKQLQSGAWVPCDHETQPPADAALSEVANQVFMRIATRPTDKIPQAVVDVLAAFAEKVRAEAIEECAKLCERVRCRTWSPEECARQIREQVGGSLARAGSGT